MDWLSVLIVAFLLIAVVLWVLYLIIRAGVRDGMLLYRAQIKDAQKAQKQAKEQHQALCGSCGQLYSEELPACPYCQTPNDMET